MAPRSSKPPTIIAICLCVFGLLGVARAEDAPSLRIDSVVLSPLQVAEVSAQQAGLLRKIAVEEGAAVAAGESLMQLDARQAEVDVAKARLEYEQAKARAENRLKIEFADKSLEVARAELKRSQESIAEFSKSISQSQLDVEKLTVDKLTLERQQAELELSLDRFTAELKEQELAAAELRLGQHRVLAPFAGTIVLIRGRVGEWVELGTPVARLVAVETLRAEGFLDAAAMSDDLVGKAVRFFPAAKTGQTVSGVLRFVSPEIDPVTNQVRVWAEIDNGAQGLRSGQQGILEIAR